MKTKKPGNFLKKLRISKALILTSVIIIFFYLVAIFTFFLFYKNRIMPKVFVGNIYLGELVVNEAESKLASKIQVPDSIKLSVDKDIFEISLKEIGLSYDIKETVKNAYMAKRTDKNVLSILLNKRVVLKPTYAVNNEKINENVSEILKEINVDPIYPHLYIKDGIVGFEKGKSGEIIEKNEILSTFNNRFLYFDFSPISLSTKVVDVTIDEQKIQKFKERGEKFVGKKMILKSEDSAFEYNDEKVIELLDSNSGFNSLRLGLITKDIESQLNREPQDSVFVFEEGRVKEFTPSIDGLRVDTKLLALRIEEYLNNLEKGNVLLSEEQTVSVEQQTVEIALERISPKITTESVNNLGIKELIGKGDSKFAGSITSRIHNISLASSKFNGVLVAPGEVFSFNKTLGDVSKYTGYKQAYIIRDGQTVLGDGGGVCQVSTTLFRALLNAGLPIVERRAHSYRVGYYEQGSPPGIDATVYDPTTDLKFKNDTPKYILIQTKVDTSAKTLVFELYGTNDGRTATITKPVITSVTSPPEDLYIDDPTLPMGQIKQIDYKAWGAKVNFKYSVERDGEIIYEKTFFSNYQPWQAKFLRGTGPNS